MSDVVETVTLNTVGTNCLTLLENGAAVNITTLTRVKLDLGEDDAGNGLVIDSDVDTGVFDWTMNGAEGKLLMTLGVVLDSKLGTPGRFNTSLIVFDPNYPDPGLIWINRYDQLSDNRLFIQVFPEFGT